jgi:hypothetical protein
LQELDALEYNSEAVEESDLEEPFPKQTLSSLLSSTESVSIDAPDEPEKDIHYDVIS